MKTIILSSIIIGLGIPSFAQQNSKAEQQPTRNQINTTPIPGQRVEQPPLRTPVVSTPIPGQRVVQNPKADMELGRKNNPIIENKKTNPADTKQMNERNQAIGRDGIISNEDLKKYNTPKEKTIQQRSSTITDGLTEDQKAEQQRTIKKNIQVEPKDGENGIKLNIPKK